MDCILDTPIHANSGCFFANPIFFLDRTVSLTVSDANGNPLASLAGLSWSWFDQEDAGLLVAPTDQGAIENTDPAGLLEIPLDGSALTEGQIGTLVLRSDDGTSFALYNLEVGPNGSFVFSTPIDARGECIFDSEFLVVSAATVARLFAVGPKKSKFDVSDEEEETLLHAVMVIILELI